MAELWVDQAETKQRLATFFQAAKKDLHLFGETVNQTFEAHVFAALVAHYGKLGWDPKLMHPGKRADGTAVVRLKFNTRGKPKGYTYALCTKGGVSIQIRHQLRVSTAHRTGAERRSPNICLDVAVIENLDLDRYTTDQPVPNGDLLSFGEAKHMSAYAELVAQFLGIVHEMMPHCLQGKEPSQRYKEHPAPFLFVSGKFYPSAEGIRETIEARGLRVSFFNHTSGFEEFPLATKPAPPKPKKARKPRVAEFELPEGEIPF